MDTRKEGMLWIGLDQELLKIVKKNLLVKVNFFSVTTLQSNVKLSQERFWHCHENGIVKTFPIIPHKLHVSFKSVLLYRVLG